MRVLESEADGYAAFLNALRSLHLAARDFGAELGLDLQPPLDLLERDLVDLGVPLAPVPRTSLELRTPAEALGLVYVLEDSTLGGTTAARRVRALWNVLGRGNPPLRYLSSEGLDVGARWRAFVRCVDAFSAAHPQAQSAVIAGARRAHAELNAQLGRTWPRASAELTS
ncbi:MAG: biliverdin-producing heme oxygenase [Myxococcaceae bacterium]